MQGQQRTFLCANFSRTFMVTFCAAFVGAPLPQLCSRLSPFGELYPVGLWLRVSVVWCIRVNDRLWDARLAYSLSL